MKMDEVFGRGFLRARETASAFIPSTLLTDSPNPTPASTSSASTSASTSSSSALSLDGTQTISTPPSSATDTPVPQATSGSEGSGLSRPAFIAIHVGVSVAIVAVLILLIFLFCWCRRRRRRQRLQRPGTSWSMASGDTAVPSTFQKHELEVTAGVVFPHAEPELEGSPGTTYGIQLASLKRPAELHAKGVVHELDGKPLPATPLDAPETESKVQQTKDEEEDRSRSKKKEKHANSWRRSRSAGRRKKQTQSRTSLRTWFSDKSTDSLPSRISSESSRAGKGRLEELMAEEVRLQAEIDKAWLVASLEKQQTKIREEIAKLRQG
ncbi:hypothetical protein QBC46DRAFT_397810 [Diplogelasinospora grovesii]|uniref:Uncharacterized protein n=1 Tax=Diplogelasinospora grovesii TaxID=303347 RepID=A0AAN6MZZ1_9PEZI|nr:hypothetical protein QBC46DRAFT_397810 [Diplogelasinospora grovesii]